MTVLGPQQNFAPTSASTAATSTLTSSIAAFPVQPVARVVIAGYGNPLRGDDGAGWRVAMALASNPRSAQWGQMVRVLAGAQPLPEWAPEFSEAGVVYLVDAKLASRFNEDAAPGLLPNFPTIPALPGAPATPVTLGALPDTHNVHMQRLTDETGRWVGEDIKNLELEGLVNAHVLDPMNLLGLCRMLYNRVPETFLVTVPAEAMDFGHTLSPRTAQAVHSAVHFLGQRITAHMAAAGVTPPPTTMPSAVNAGRQEAPRCV